MLRRAREYQPVLIAIIIGALQLSDQLTLALAARGLGYTQKRTSWRELRFRHLDWWVLALSTLVFAAGWGASLVFPAL
ncbi:MAG: Energy-coupling factor transporter transmembrane protein EcfT [Chloroflexi bacterium ADurb.Bin360]|nr:MAG: Energy-coupling factor transporter transmembrane protein EcfT [Chloroflexi bacterium ADurb.Bin360]